MSTGQAARSLPVPNRGDPDRKRALNVLAQRRYRQRKRERLLTLERQVQSTTPSSSGRELPDLAQGQHQPPSRTTRSPRDGSASSETMDISDISRSSSISSIPSPNQLEIMWNEFINPSPDGIDMSASATSTGTASDQNALSSMLTTSMAALGTTFFPIPSDSIDLGAELQDLTASQFTFADDGSLTVPELKVLNAGLYVAELLGCANTIFDFATRGVVNVSPALLPPAYIPTAAQRQIPHHPILDLLPWPEVRTRMILVFSQPEAIRPPAARDPMALVNLVYDMDDSAEGLRVEGEDQLNGENWEVGQQFFQNWWWALDRSVIENSNRLRSRRGASRLQLMAG